MYECVLEDCCSGRIARAKVDVSVPSEPCSDPKLQMFGMVWQYKSWDDALQFCQDKVKLMDNPSLDVEPWSVL